MSNSRSQTNGFLFLDIWASCAIGRNRNLLWGIAIVLSLFVGTPQQAHSAEAQMATQSAKTVKASPLPASPLPTKNEQYYKAQADPQWIVIATAQPITAEDRVTDFEVVTKAILPQESTIYPVTLVERLKRIAQSNVAEVRPLAELSEETLRFIDSFVIRFESEPASAVTDLQELEKAVTTMRSIRTSWNPAAINRENSSTDAAEYVPSSVSIEEVQLALERRVILWRQATLAAATPAFPVGKHFKKGIDDLNRLRNLTRKVCDYFYSEESNTAPSTAKNPGDYEIGKRWAKHLETDSFLSELEACQESINHPIRRVSMLISTIPITTLVSFSDRANVAVSRLDGSSLNQAQKRFLDVPAVNDWRVELAQWTSDTVSPRALLQTLEEYESKGGMSDMEKLFSVATRLSFAKTGTFKKLGRLTLELYGNSNIMIYVSKALVNHLLPERQAEVAAFKDIIVGQPVYGRRWADTAVAVNFIPDPDRLLLNFEVRGKVAASSRSNAFATTLLGQSYANYVAKKPVELTSYGIKSYASSVSVNNRMELRGIRTDVDRVPIVSTVFREIVRGQYEQKEVQAKEESRQKIARQVRDRIDLEIEEHAATFNGNFQTKIHGFLTGLNLHLEQKNSVTETDWLLTRWALRSQGSLTGNTPAPETLPGSFADIKVHESAINALFGKLDFSGKNMTIGEFRQQIGEKLQRPEFLEPGDNDDVRIAFAPYNPVIVRFADGRVEITISIASLTLRNETHKNFKVMVAYKSAYNAEGELVLERDGIIRLIDARGQFVLRAVFGKVFPEKRPLVMTPKILKEDPRFADSGLITGHCRIEKGWFAIALIGGTE